MTVRKESRQDVVQIGRCRGIVRENLNINGQEKKKIVMSE